MKQRSILIASILFILLIISISLGVYFTQKQSKHENQLTEINFRLKWIKYSSFAHHFVAQKKGYFNNENLEVTIHEGGAGIDPIKSVVSGIDDIGLASYAQILIAREKGIPVIAIAEEYINSGAISMSLASSGITSPKDFIGKTIGVIPGSDTYTVYSALLKKEGVSKDSLTEINVGFDLKPLLSGTVDVITAAFITNQPIFAESQGYNVNIIDPHDYGIKTGGNVFFTTEYNLNNKREELIRFLSAAFRGIEESQKMPNEDVVNIVLEVNPKLKKGAEMKIWQATKDYLLEKRPDHIGVMSKDKWEETAQLFYNFGLLNSEPNINKAFTNELVNEIHGSSFK
ncbi:MAG: ABC transporter substrate-binding protein [Chitinophagales bacterium]